MLLRWLIFTDRLLWAYIVWCRRNADFDRQVSVGLIKHFGADRLADFEMIGVCRLWHFVAGGCLFFDR